MSSRSTASVKLQHLRCGIYVVNPPGQPNTGSETITTRHTWEGEKTCHSLVMFCGLLEGQQREVPTS